MIEPYHLSDLLQQHVKRAYHTPGQLARLTGLPKATIVNWLEGRVSKPRHRDDMLKLASALHLNAQQVSELLRAAGYLVALPPPSEDGGTPQGQQCSSVVPPAPFQVIADLPYFVGRSRYLSQIENILTGHEPGGAVNRMVILQGMAGAGKTALAAHVAYRLRAQFPDGVLWAQLDAMDTMSILSLFAGAYGRDVAPFTNLHSRSALLRGVLSGKRALIVLDNVLNSEQVEPLLPPTGDCAVILTTRQHNLRVGAGLSMIEVGPFDRKQGEGLALFREFLGVARADAERSTLLQIAESLDNSPLALGIAASRLSYEPDYSAADLLAGLSSGSRLDELVYESWSVRLSLQPGYDVLPEHLRSLFLSLCVFGSNDFDPPAVAAANGLTLRQARDSLRRLYSLSLVQAMQLGRYRLHPLLADFARERLSSPEPYERAASYFVEYLLHHSQDREAIDLDLGNILHSLGMAYALGLHDLLLRSTETLCDLLERRRLYDVAAEQIERAMTVARTAGERRPLASALRNSGRIHMFMGAYSSAETCLREGLAIAEELEDTPLVCDLLVDLAATLLNLTRREDAEHCCTEALRLARQGGYPRQAGLALTYFAIAERMRGNHDKAQGRFEQAMCLVRETGDPDLAIRLFANLRAIVPALGRFPQAGEYIEQGLVLAATNGHGGMILMGLLENAACLARQAGRPHLAREYYSKALAIARQVGRFDRINHFLASLATEQSPNEVAES
jgi:tetratricopeptide (TPR) repeat protein